MCYVAAAGIGIAAAFFCERLVGFLAARPWPSWYISWANGHKHLALDLSWTVMALLPSITIAIACGLVLTILWRRASMGIALVASGAWLVYYLCTGIIGDLQICIYPVQCLLAPFRLEPITSLLSMFAPATMWLGYRWVRQS